MSSAYYNKAGQQPTQNGDHTIMANRNFYRRQQRPAAPPSPFLPPPPPPFYRDSRIAANAHPPPWYGHLHPNAGPEGTPYGPIYPMHEQEYRQRHFEQQRRQHYPYPQMQPPPHLPPYYSPAAMHQQLPPPQLYRRLSNVSTVPSPHINTTFNNQPLLFDGSDLTDRDPYSRLKVFRPGIDLSSNSDFVDPIMRMEASWGYPPAEWYTMNMEWLQNNERYRRPRTDGVEGTGFLAEIERGMLFGLSSLFSADHGEESCEVGDLIIGTQTDVGSEMAALHEATAEPEEDEAPAPSQQQRERQTSLQSVDFDDWLVEGGNDWEQELDALPDLE